MRDVLGYLVILYGLACDERGMCVASLFLSFLLNHVTLVTWDHRCNNTVIVAISEAFMRAHTIF